MIDPTYAPLLRDQIANAGFSDEELAKFTDFFDKVNETYQVQLHDSCNAKRKLEISSKRLLAAHKKLEKEHRLTKSQLGNIVDHIRGVIFETDLYGNFTYLNQAWTKYTGFGVCESIGKNSVSFLSAADTQTVGALRQFFEKKEEKITLVFKYEGAQDVFWVELRCKRIFNADGSANGYIGTLIDVTESKKTEIQLQKSNLAKDSFMSTMSHEIRTPLNAVTGIASILLMEEHLPHQKESLMALHNSGKHLLGLINDLLDFNKLTSGKVEVVHNEFNLDIVLEEIQSKFFTVAQERRLKFIVSKGCDLPKNLVGDVLKLNRILENLLSNAFKFTENGSVKLFVQNKGYSENGVELRFKVIDTGIGIAEEKQEIIFESFVQADSDTAVRYGGTGLGLAICKELLEMQNSRLQLESRPGKGSCFEFVLNFGLTEKQMQASPSQLNDSGQEQLDIKILIAEDNKLNILILKRLLSRWGVTYSVATDGQQLLEMYKEEDADLILMDIQMPVLDGYQTTDYIRNLSDTQKAEVPIIALTALAQSDIEKKTRKHRMNGFMLKPFNTNELYSLLKRYSKTLAFEAD